MSEKNENNNTVEETVHYPYVVSICFEGNKKNYYFGSKINDLKVGDKAVVETVRGLEIGTVAAEPVKEDQVNLKSALKPLIRKATKNDLEAKEKNKESAKKAMDICQQLVTKLNLDMNLISAEYTLDCSKVIFVYVADERVDFRELLKELASALHCRIELRQIGMRDKAKMVGGIGVCGRECCCSKYLNSFDVVSINMAKNQLLALNTQKLSGQCGKLMCCLKYEDETYKELRTGLPKMNSHVSYQGKTYRMTSLNVLTHQVRLENKEEVLYLDVKEVFPEAPEPRPTEVTVTVDGTTHKAKNHQPKEEKKK